ncbi:MAG TPA: ATP-binding protein [Nocardioidaceae bacterium]|nr:ATP-binding protein [Nocardioidaceae bacterium]
MPLNSEPFRLEPDPAAVKQAREWVNDVLERLGRTDLLDAAELGISELVTNAILHADPPITVRLRGTRQHPRVEVRDHSHDPPEVNVEMTDEEHLLSTIGRGLGIVALYSSTWGSEVVPDGKTVWFEPAREVRTDGDLSGEVFDLEEVVHQRLASVPAPDQLIRVRLQRMPVQVFDHFRNRYNELRRELRLLSLAHSGDYPVARELSELFLQVEAERRLAHGVNALDEAIEAGLDQVDLQYDVPPSAPASMGRMLEMLEKADQFCREQRLLALAASPQQLELQRWYLGEFVRQGAGEAATPWTGALTVEDAERPAP